MRKYALICLSFFFLVFFSLVVTTQSVFTMGSKPPEPPPISGSLIENRVDEIISMIDALPYDEMIKIKCDLIRPIND